MTLRTIDTPRAGHIRVGVLANPRYGLQHPVELRVETDELSNVVVSDAFFNQYGVGETLWDALRDYEAMLIDYYEELTTTQQPLGPGLVEHFTYLRELIATK